MYLLQMKQMQHAKVSSALHGRSSFDSSEEEDAESAPDKEAAKQEASKTKTRGMLSTATKIRSAQEDTIRKSIVTFKTNLKRRIKDKKYDPSKLRSRIELISTRVPRGFRSKDLTLRQSNYTSLYQTAYT